MGMGASSWSGGGGGGAAKASKEKTSDVMPEIVNLQVSAESPYVQQGYPPDIVAIEFDKRLTLFSESHHILQSIFSDQDIKEVCQFEHDPECTTFPEIYQAWKAQGREDNCPTVALIPGLKVWAVGLGGKVNANRAAKLAAALSCATLIDPTKLAEIVGN